MPDRLLSVPTVAALIDMRESTVRTYCKTGVFPNARKVAGGPWRIPECDVNALTDPPADAPAHVRRTARRRRAA